MSEFIEIVISVLILSGILFAGYLLGKTVASLKYGKRIDELKREIEVLEEHLHKVHKDIRKGKYSK